MPDAEAIQNVVTIAFCLEPLAEKEGCTSRSVDLPGLPLTDFIIAGINVSKYFRFLAQDIIDQKQPDVFLYFSDALKVSNRYKSSKTLNFGLLEIMFPTVYARLLSPDKKNSVDTMLDIMKKKNRRDVDHLIMARIEGWKTSTKEEKRNFNGTPYISCESPYDFYMELFNSYPESNSCHEWAAQFKLGLPIVHEALAALAVGSRLEAMTSVYDTVRKDSPRLNPGLIADFCAAALFIHLSYE